MKPSRWPLSLVYALLLVGCAYFAGHQVFGIMFGIGESGESIGLLGGAFLIVTALGTVGFGIAAVGAFSKVRAFGFLGVASAVAVLPASGFLAWQEFLPFALDLAAIALSVLWLRQLE